ncbi:MAG TPA: 6-phosphofructokinase [Fimbriimonadales bacterium]|nr:6-phosphofructokinase [Fimbriimonadales bacterium]
MQKRFAVLTSGGDAPGMNAAIRAVVRSGLGSNLEVFGVAHGYAGLMRGEISPMSSVDVGAIISLGGTVLRSSRTQEFMERAGRVKAAKNLEKLGIEALIVIGGDGSLTGASVFAKECGCRVIGIPASIDNDIPATDNSIGFETAVDTALNAIDHVRDTAYSHDRVFVIEVMGRRNGFIALEAGLAGGAEEILIPERPVDLAAVCKRLIAGRKRGKQSSIIVVAEGAAKAADVCSYISREMDYEARYLVLGHMQRGGSPCAYDRVLATRFGAAAVRRMFDGASDEYVGISANKIISTEISIGLASDKPIDEQRLELAQMMAR